MFELHNGDCLEVMATLPGQSVDLILCDLPYGTTACAWDAVIPFEPLWAQYRRLLRPGGVVILTAAQPFTTQVIASNLREFRYCWYWNKKAVTGFANAKFQPLRCIEDVVVFYASKPTYNPQGLVRFDKVVNKGTKSGGGTPQGSVAGGDGSLRKGLDYFQEWTNYPRQILEIARDASKLHPTQKPVALMEYLIRTYTNPDDVVLDNTMGSGTTGVAAMHSGRRFIGIERDPDYFAICQRRIAEARPARSNLVDLTSIRADIEAARAIAALQARLAVRFA